MERNDILQFGEDIKKNEQKLQVKNARLCFFNTKKGHFMKFTIACHLCLICGIKSTKNRTR
jgi:hypothetical protein